jgi:antitoxin ParD1/3/4
MRTTKQLSITLPTNMAAAIKERVASGEYATESEVIRDGLRALFARDAAMETWLQTEVVAAIKAIDDDPSRGVSADEVRAALRENASQRERAVQQ